EQQVSDQVGSAQGVDLSLLKQPLKQALQILSQFVPSSETGNRALARLPYYEGYEWRRSGPDVVLIAVGTGIVYEILEGVLN
ncbi:RcnB family protein, partial [Pseudomonas sp. TNT11]